MTDTTLIRTPIAPGELIDKITILQIKEERIEDTAKLRNIREELSVLRAEQNRHLSDDQALQQIGRDLKAVNEEIWALEDVIRDHERRQDFGPGFVETARLIYKTNDRRAALKRDINLHLGSRLVEEKSYQPY